jgi:hypothetical protein
MISGMSLAAYSGILLTGLSLAAGAESANRLSDPAKRRKRV